MKVFYKRIIEGQTIHAIIHNGGYYHIDMAVYEDGSVSCWERVGLDELEQTLAKAWLVTEVPAGEALDIHGLGVYEIKKADWRHTPDSFIGQIRDRVKRMNPEMEGLYKETRVQKERWEQSRVSWSATPIPYKLEANFGYNISRGQSTNLFHRSGELWELTALTAFPDKTLTVDAIPEKWFQPEEISQMFEAGILKSKLKGRNRIQIEDLGTITAVARFATADKDKQLEIADMLAKVCKRSTSLDLCRNAYHVYLEQPTEEARKRLRQAYEAVPEHERMYLGDMDSKDWDYRRILYSNNKWQV